MRAVALIALALAGCTDYSAEGLRVKTEGRKERALAAGIGVPSKEWDIPWHAPLYRIDDAERGVTCYVQPETMTTCFATEPAK